MKPINSFRHMNLKEYLPAITAGFIAVLVGFTSSAVIVIQAAKAAGATADQTGSWMMALGIGMGITTIGLSLRYKTPIITAWSTPGAALLATSLTNIPMNEAIGAFVFSALLMIISGITGWFEKIINRIPLAIAAAMLAGILFQFGIDVFSSMENRLLLVGCMFASYLLMKKLLPRYAIVIVLITGLLICQFQGLLNFNDFEFVAVNPQFVVPAFSISTLIGVGIPLFIVTMVSQNLPGIAVLRAAGYQTPLSPLVSWTGFATLVLAPLGGYALNLAAITAAICTGQEAHENPGKRYIATLSAGFFYLLLGFSGAAVVGLFNAFPTEFVLALAGLALLSTIANSLSTAVTAASTREAAVITFLVTASGMNIFGIGSAFWGLVAGFAALWVFKAKN